MKVRLAHWLLAAFLVSAAWVPIADAQGAIKKGHSEIVFQNATSATIRVNVISSPGEEAVPPKTAKPKSTVSFTVKSGPRKFGLVAYLARPMRIHTIALQLKESETSDFRIIPHMMGVYILEDAAAPSALPMIGRSGTGKGEPGAADPGTFEKECRQAVASKLSEPGLVIWRPGVESGARYYRRAAGLLCSLDGLGVYATGNINAHFSCERGWRNCRRDTAGDAMFLPPIRTSNLLDTPRRLARKDHPKAFAVRTRNVEWLRSDKPGARITSYILPRNATPTQRCPEGYRLHYQGFCINREDELRDDPVKGVRGVQPDTVPK